MNALKQYGISLLLSIFGNSMFLFIFFIYEREKFINNYIVLLYVISCFLYSFIIYFYIISKNMKVKKILLDAGKVYVAIFIIFIIILKEL